MKMPVTNVSVMIPDGRIINAVVNASNHTVGIDGLKFGSVVLEKGERFAVRDMLNLIYPDE